MSPAPGIGATPRKFELSPHKRTRIVLSRELGLSHIALAAREGISPKPISGISQRYQIQKSGTSRNRAGHPQILDPGYLCRIKRLLSQNPFISAQEIVDQAGLPCAARTVSRGLVKPGIQHHKALRRPKLTSSHAAARMKLAYARLIPILQVRVTHPIYMYRASD